MPSRAGDAKQAERLRARVLARLSDVGDEHHSGRTPERPRSNAVESRRRQAGRASERLETPRAVKADRCEGQSLQRGIAVEAEHTNG